MTQSDSDELVAARRIVDGYPLLQALREWKKAHERRTANQDCKPISVSAAKKRFIDEGLNAGKQHDRTYGSALKSLVDAFPNRQLHTIETTELTTALAKFLDGVTRNSYRKKWRALFSWARKNKHLPKDKTLEIDDTQLAAENSPEVGIITPEVFAKVLMYMHDYHPHYLAATVLAGFCGMRSDEIHGKRVKSTKGGQLWRDIYTQADELNTFPFLQVSNAKNNTPAWRRTPLPPAAVEWLNLVPIGTRGEFVCQKFAMDRVREIAISAGLILPENAFRHSYISYACERTGNKNQVAIDAGTSVEKIDKYYRRPVPHALALQWNELTPDHCRKNFAAVRQKTPSENGAKGWIGSKSQRIAANENLRKGRKSSV